MRFTMGPLRFKAAARSKDVRFALAGIVVPVIAAASTNALEHRAPFWIGAAAACVAAVAMSVLDRRRRQVLFRLAAFGVIPALALMQSYSGGVASGYSVLVMMAMIWFGLRATQRELLAGAILLAVCSYLPMLLVGPPAYPVQWGHATMLMVIGCTVAATLNGVRGEAQRLTHKLRQEAVIDDLTGLLNRRGWRGMATVEFQRARHQGGTAALVTIDLDQFKALNDQHGHDHGDRALREAAHWMQASFRGGVCRRPARRR